MIRITARQHGQTILYEWVVSYVVEGATATERPCIRYTLSDGSEGVFTYGNDVAIDIRREAAQ